jgi:hypothetical protein
LIIVNAVTSLALQLTSYQTRRNAPIFVGPTCQSELKRTLRQPRSGSETTRADARFPQSGSAFGADGERKVSIARAGGFDKKDGTTGAKAAANAASIENLHRIEFLRRSHNFLR